MVKTDSNNLYMTEINGVPPMPENVFKQRKNIINDLNKSID